MSAKESANSSVRNRAQKWTPSLRYFSIFCFPYARLCCSDLFTVTRIVFSFDGHILSAYALAHLLGDIHVLHCQVSFTQEPLCWRRALLQKRRAYVEILARDMLQIATPTYEQVNGV